MLMTTYKTATHQNLSVWARRLGMKIVDLDKGAAFADSLFKQPSRRGVLIALAIRHVAQTNELPMTDAGMIAVGNTMGNILYDRVYGDRKYENVALAFREEMLKRRDEGQVTHNQAADLIALHHATALDWVTRGIANRDGESRQPSLVNAILAKARR
jgi:hypothetical protein